MNHFLAFTTFSILAVTAMVHAYWALGGCWPAQDRQSLPGMVVGTERKVMPSRGLTLLIAVMIILAGAVPIFWTQILPIAIDRQLQAVAMMIVATIFLLRGIITYTPIAAKYPTVEPFGTLNKKYYSPLCLILGLSFVSMLFY